MPLSNASRVIALPLVLVDATTYYVGLLTTLPDYAEAGAVEVVDTAYARAAHGVWITVAGTGTVATTRANSGEILFPQLVAAPLPVLGFGIYDVPSGGALRAYGFLKHASTGDVIAMDYRAGDVPKILDQAMRI